MKVILVRHGETEENVRGISQGHFDSKLNENGKRQAKLVAERLKNEKVDAIYTSDLTRAYDTAVQIHKYHKCDLIKNEKLRERRKGKYEGKPNTIRDDRIKELNISYDEFDFDGGETFFQVRKRVRHFLDKIVNLHKGQNVLLVSHGEAIMAIFLNLLDKPSSEYLKYMPRKNTAISIVNVNNGIVDIELLNSSKHLLS